MKKLICYVIMAMSTLSYAMEEKEAVIEKKEGSISTDVEKEVHRALALFDTRLTQQASTVNTLAGVISQLASLCIQLKESLDHHSSAIDDSAKVFEEQAEKFETLNAKLAKQKEGNSVATIDTFTDSVKKLTTFTNTCTDAVKKVQSQYKEIHNKQSTQESNLLQLSQEIFLLKRCLLKQSSMEVQTSMQEILEEKQDTQPNEQAESEDPKEKKD